MEDNGLSEFATDVYDVLAKNTSFCTQEQFFDKYVADDDAFMIMDEGGKQYILFDNYKITIEKK